MALLPRTWRAARLVAEAGENIANVLAYGAVGDGGAGKYMELTHYGTVKLVCNVAGRWAIQSIGAWNDPGAAGAPTPGWLWEA